MTLNSWQHSNKQVYMDAHEQEYILICTHTYTYTYRYKQTINNTARILVYRLSPTKFLYTISIKDYKKKKTCESDWTKINVECVN